MISNIPVNWPTVKDVVVATCAAIGALLGIYNFIQFRKSQKTRLELFADYGRSLHKVSASGDDLSFDTVLIETENVGHRHTGIDDVYLKVRFKKSTFSLTGVLEEINVDSLYKAEKFKTSNREIKGGERRHFEVSLTEFIPYLITLKEKTTFAKLWVRLIKIGVKTSTGKKFEKRPGKRLRKEMLKLV